MLTTDQTCSLGIEDYRRLFLSKTKNVYKLVSPDPLINEAFPTSFTSSAGPNLASKVLLSKENLNSWNRASVIQPCLRYWDIENVGDGRHLSFFEMATLFRVDGDRWKTLLDIFQFLVNDLLIDPNRIWATYYAGGKVIDQEFPADTDAVKFLKNVGLSQEKIVPVLGAEGFVANKHEVVGGYRTELYVEQFSECSGSCQECLPGLDQCGRFIEVATFITYEFSVDLNQKIPIKWIDTSPVHATGFGIERACQVIQHAPDIHHSDVMILLRDIILMLSCIKASQNKNHNRLANIVADHIRGITFLASEGAEKLSGRSNRGRKWVVNRYVKSLLQNTDLLDLPFEKIVSEIVPIVAKVYDPNYPFLMQNLSEIQMGVEDMLSKSLTK